jgi:pimeloyl-ACP methyl ester carboxylesterase
MKFRSFSTVAALAAVLLGAGCAKYDLKPLTPAEASGAEQALGSRLGKMSREQENRILALNPERVTPSDVRNVLAGAPAPRIINIHGGIAPVQKRLTAFSKFLAGMGYPDRALRLPSTGEYTISCYYEAELFAGIAAWFYEHDGMRPMILGHSQGCMQAVKTLQLFAGQSGKRLAVWSPLTWKPEERTEITDPLTGKKRPVVGLSISYIGALGGGGLGRVLPNQWDIMFSLRSVPDTVDEFTGFYLSMDVLGGDYLGFGPANHYHATGHAKVRNVQLPAHSLRTHATTPEIEHLLSNPEAIAWINNYAPSTKPVAPAGMRNVEGIEFGADVWKSVKRHWVIELQRLIRARRASGHGR